MVSKESRTKVRLNKHRKIRNRFAGTAERPRLAVLEVIIIFTLKLSTIQLVILS